MKLTDTHRSLADTHKRLVEAEDSLHRILQLGEGQQEHLAALREVVLSIEKSKKIVDAVLLRELKDSSRWGA